MAHSASIGRLGARLMKRAGFQDVILLILIAVAGAAVLYSGWRSKLQLSPEAARDVRKLIVQLEMPRYIPDAVLEAENGNPVSFHSLLKNDWNIVNFYAPWCGPCQEELPKLAAERENGLNLVVIIDKREKIEKTRDKLADLGLDDLAFYLDRTGGIYDNARVTSLPTTYLLDRLGRVDRRCVGYNQYYIEGLVYKARGEKP